MNKLIFRKFSYDILTFFILSTMSFTLIVWVIQGVNLLDIVSEQGHAIRIYLLFSVTNIPKIFSKLMIFTYFLTLFVILNRYKDNNEILIFWTNGIKKITFINFLGKISFVFVILHLVLNLYVVPYTQNLGQKYLINSSVDFFPKLIQEKKFSNVSRNITIFVEEYNGIDTFEGIYIKEKLDDSSNKIIVASEGRLIQNRSGYSFKLLDGKITNIDSKVTFNLGFKETIYDISKLNSKTRKEMEVDEIESAVLISCLEKYLHSRKNNINKCGKENQFFLKDIYEELFKRIIGPLYIVILSLMSSLLILKSKKYFFQKYFKLFLFFVGFVIIIISELSYKFIFSSDLLELTFICLPVISILIFYCYILIKTNFNLQYL